MHKLVALSFREFLTENLKIGIFSGNCFGVATSDKKVKVYDLRMQRLQQLYSAHEGPVSQVSFHPNGSYLISASQDGCMKIFDLFEARPIYDVMGHKSGVNAVKFNSKGNLENEN